MKDRQPKIYYDCAPDYKSCTIHNRSQNSNFQLKANIHCPSDVRFGSDAMAGVSPNSEDQDAVKNLPRREHEVNKRITVKLKQANRKY